MVCLFRLCLLAIEMGPNLRVNKCPLKKMKINFGQSFTNFLLFKKFKAFLGYDQFLPSLLYLFGHLINYFWLKKK